MFQRMKIIAVVSLAIGMLLITNVVMACPVGQVPCGTNGCCECGVSFTTENGDQEHGDVVCLIDIRDVYVIRCSVSEFVKIPELSDVSVSEFIKIPGHSDVTVEFDKRPSLAKLDTALTAKCGNHIKCAEKFQCQKHGGCPVGQYQCESETSEVCCPNIIGR